jgi:putative acetyltransferase
MHSDVGENSDADRQRGNLTIRAEKEADFPAIFDVVATAFGSMVEADLVDAIRASANYIPQLSLVAEVEGEVVGHVMISYASLHARDIRRPIAMLSPLAVSPEFQRRGIGSALVREATSKADDRGEPLVVLEGSPAFYARFGFEHSLVHGIRIALPAWAPPEAAQVLRLHTYHPSFSGHVVYPPAFDHVADH